MAERMEDPKEVCPGEQGMDMTLRDLVVLTGDVAHWS